MSFISRLYFSSPAAGLALALLSALCLVVSIPTIDWWPFAWIAFVPVMVALYDQMKTGSLWRVYTIALTFSFFTSVGKVYWIAETVMSYGGLNLILGVFSMAVVASLLALYLFVFCIFVARADWLHFAFPFLTAALWIALEYIQTYLFTGFPWELLGYSQYRVLPVIQIARFTGVYGVGFLVMLVNATLAMVFIAIREGRNWRGPAFAMSLTCFLMIGVTGYGWWTLSRVHRLEGQTQPVRIAVVQGNIEQGMKWSEAILQKTVDIYADLTRSILAEKPAFIVFPETAMTFYLKSPVYQAFTDQVNQLVDEAGVPILTGALGYRSGERAIYNSAFLLSPGRGIVAQYSKMHLVPFGEYLPMPTLFYWLSGLTADIGSLTPGDKLTIMTLKEHDMRIGTVICYESIFPDLARQFALNGANVLVVMTNDAWFGTSTAPMQHFSMAVLRAVENGMPIIRAANTGISGYISATGRVYGQTPLMATTTTIGQIYPSHDTATVYTTYGDIFAMVCCVLAVMAVVVAGRRKSG